MTIVDFLMILWFSMNIPFGMFSLRNFIVKLVAIISNVGYNQSTFGKILDCFVVGSIIAYAITAIKLGGII